MDRLLKLLGNRYWRLNNLYFIVNKRDKLVPFRINSAQKILFSIKHPKTITLKSRQRGISTYKVIEGLDKCLFNANTQAGIQSYGLTESRKLYRKALVAWENMDPDIKDILEITLVSSNQEGLTFSNGSTLRIGNFRGDTLSSLHVSELAKIAIKFPEKAEELNTGAFEAVATDSTISIESTAEGASGLFYDIWTRAVARMAIVKKTPGIDLTPLDFYPIFLSWVDDPDCRMKHYYEATPEHIKYFNKVEQDLKIVLTQEQKNWCSAKLDRLGNKFDREYPYSPKAAFEQTIEGAYYSNEFKNLRVESSLYDPNLLVHSALDIGISDPTAVIFFQLHPTGVVKIIGDYAKTGEGLPHFAEVYRALGKKLVCTFGTTLVPHDIVVREWISAKTRLQAMQEMGFNPILVKKHRVNDGIEATRQLLKTIVVDAKAEDTLLAIQMYRRKYDRKFNIYLDTPEHDIYSHIADSLRYLAMGIKHNSVSDVYVNKPITHIKHSYNNSMDI